VIVYKYGRASIGIQILEKEFIRFTQADALNDPFEIRPCMTEFRAGIIEEGQALLGGNQMKSLAKMRRQFPSALSSHDPYGAKPSQLYFAT
jgi:hypothetical protein